MDNIDRELLYMLLEAEKTGEPVSTWELAGSKTSNPTERNVLDGLYRYHLRRLAEQGFVIEEKTTRGKQKITYYRINPKKILCVNGSLFLLVNPIMIYECPYADKCNACNKPIKFYKTKKGQLKVRGCKLLAEAPEHVKETVYKHLSGEA